MFVELNSIMDSKKLEIFGILTAMVSLLIFVSLIGYNPNEDPGISPNIKVENPMGILGVWIGYALIKLSFGYISLLIPFLIMTWGIWFFSKKSFEKKFCTNNSLINCFLYQHFFLQNHQPAGEFLLSLLAMI